MYCRPISTSTPCSPVLFKHWGILTKQTEDVAFQIYSLFALVWISRWVIRLAAFPPRLILLHKGEMPCGRRKGAMFSFKICHVIQNGPAEFASPHDCGIHCGHTSNRDNLEKWHLLNASGKSLMNNVSLLAMHRSSALVGSEGDGSTHRAHTTIIIIIIIMIPIMHGAACCTVVV